MDTSRYPKEILDRVEIHEQAYGGHCEIRAYGKIQVFASRHTLHHEMGHVIAHLMGIEQELGQRVWDTLGSEILTNDNPYCYGAQCRAAGNREQAIAEYAADAIAEHYAGNANWL